MLEIKPIQHKIEQEAACGRCGIKYDAALLAYGAHVDGNLVAVCQFTLGEGGGIIRDLRGTAGTDDREALILTARAALNFMDSCGAERVFFDSAERDEPLLREIGFRCDESDGKYKVELKGFFDSPCQRNKNKK